VLQAVAGVLKRAWLTCVPGQSVPGAWPQPCLCTRGLTIPRSVRPTGSQWRSSKRGGDAPSNPCTRNHGTTAGSPKPSSHGDGGAQEHERLRSPLHRGTAVLRLEGPHPGMF
jgi:hypothetical protein